MPRRRHCNSLPIQLGAIVFGVSVVAYVPRMIVGGVLVFVGLSFLVTWLWDVRKSLPLGEYLIQATRNGIVKKTRFKEYDTPLRADGIIAINIREGDELIGARLTSGDDDILPRLPVHWRRHAVVCGELE